MKTHQPEPRTLRVTDLPEMTAANATDVRDAVRKVITPDCRTLQLDLSQTSFLDSSGLGALVGLHKTMRLQEGILQILHPTPAVMQLLELTRLHRLLEIVGT
ncbi:MAG: STAS domain-containing protein [Verrucomicrobiales bacterium]|nr:STAS domain-containing protein [Verrucomicrobiales bacterium]MCP5526675.1 STAS domain-containing protein [Verrucomicrobiales bacterium]